VFFWTGICQEQNGEQVLCASDATFTISANPTDSTTIVVVPRGEKGDDSRFRCWPHQFDERFHGAAAPLRDAGPSLDAMMHSDVFGLT
jgi:hypothetical protein